VHGHNGDEAEWDVMRAYLGGQTLRQIGEELDTPIGTVKSALSRALVRLRERNGVEESVL